jgi:hypothetical protein
MKQPVKKWPGIISKGKFIPADPVRYFGLIFSLEEKRVNLILEPYHDSRSNNQNRYYWVCLSIIADHTGHSSEEIHDAMRARHLCDNPGEPVQIIHSTTELDTAAFARYLDKIKRDAAEGLFGASLYIPEANEIYQ